MISRLRQPTLWRQVSLTIQRQRRLASASAAAAASFNTSGYYLCEPDPQLVDARQAPPSFVPNLAVVYRDFATEKEAENLLGDVGACLKRRRYEKGHWDSVIVNYKETELLDEDSVLTSELSKNLLDRVRYQLQERHLTHKQDSITWLPCHAIDLHKEGELNAHVDSVRFSGDIVAGLSLLSPSIMRLIPENDVENDENHDKNGLMDMKKKDANGMPGVNWVDLYLPPRSLYVLADAGRYHYSHQLLPSGSVFYDDGTGSPITVERDHRISVIFRDSKDGDGDHSDLEGQKEVM